MLPSHLRPPHRPPHLIPTRRPILPQRRRPLKTKASIDIATSSSTEPITLQDIIARAANASAGEIVRVSGSLGNVGYVLDPTDALAPNAITQASQATSTGRSTGQGPRDCRRGGRGSLCRRRPPPPLHTRTRCRGAAQPALRTTLQHGTVRRSKPQAQQRTDPFRCKQPGHPVWSRQPPFNLTLPLLRNAQVKFGPGNPPFNGVDVHFYPSGPEDGAALGTNMVMRYDVR